MENKAKSLGIICFSSGRFPRVLENVQEPRGKCPGCQFEKPEVWMKKLLLGQKIWKCWETEEHSVG